MRKGHNQLGKRVIDKEVKGKGGLREDGKVTLREKVLVEDEFED